ncbi:MAG: hypothetical protein C0602_03310 [Denitrovibrio sp.]|nr:MAG: hypothetical protein C0602_03310 [Denitrovibrio sp.]
MSNYKDVLLYADENLCGQITDTVSISGVRINTVSNSADFSLMLTKDPDGVIISSDTADEYTLASLSASGVNALVAAVVDPDDAVKVSEMMKYGITRFIPKTNLEIHLCKFVEDVLLFDKKNVVLINALKRLRNLAGNVSEGIIILDDDAKINYTNKAAEDLLEMDKKEILRQTLDDIFTFHPYPIEEFTEQPVYIDNYDIETFKGKRISINSTCSANIENGVFAGAVIIFSEVSSYYMDKQKELELLKYQQRYHSSQQSMAFKKQMLVIKDEVSNIVAGDFNIETYFKPLDVLSGDIYGSINIKDGRYLFYIIDAMGKGLSASVTALQSTSFINHSLELSIIKFDFDLNRTIASFLHYIRDRLMEEEALCVVFALLDTNGNKLTVSNYGMPPILLADKNGDIKSIRPNNLPIMRCIASKNIEIVDLTDVEKIMIMSDGLIETTTKDDNLYMDYLKEDFTASYSKKHLLSKMVPRINQNEDDMTFFFIRKSNLNHDFDEEYIINSDLEEIMHLSQKLTEKMISDGVNQQDLNTVEYAVSEILMNAVEHGSLGLGYDAKQNLIADGIYDEYMIKNADKDILANDKIISLRYKYTKDETSDKSVIMISIKDQGKGFAPANIFKYHSFDGNLCHIDKKDYNGRGIFIADNLVDGLYYNENGNCAYLIKLVEN